MLKKLFTYSVVLATIVWSLGLTAVVGTASAAVTLNDGDIIKGSTAAAYYYAGGKRYVFPKDNVFFTWYPDFSKVKVIPDSQLTSISLGGNITVRPGTKLVQFVSENTSGQIVVSDPKVYAVTEGGVLHQIDSATRAATLYGANWETMILPVLETLFTNYTMGSVINSNVHPDGTLIKYEGSSTVYLIEDGKKREITSGEAFVANWFQDKYVRTTTITYPDGSDITGREADLTNPIIGKSITPPTSTGDLMVSLSPNTPPTAIVPQSATHVPFITVRLKATGGNVHVSGITFNLFGLGDDDNFDKVWLMGPDGETLSNDQSISSDGNVFLSTDFDITGGSMIDVTLAANLAGASNVDMLSQSDAFRILNAAAIDASGADVTGSFPISGNSIFYSSYDVGTATIDDRGADTEVEVGDEQEVIGEFDVDFDSGNENDGSIEMLRWRMEGTAAVSDLANVKLYEDGTVVSESTLWQGDFVTFFLKESAKLLEDGQTRAFEIRGDVVGGDDGDTFIFELDDDRDFFVVDLGSGFGSAVDTSGLPSRRLKTYDLDAGQFSLSLDASNPSNEEYAKNHDGVVALVAKVDAGQPVNVEGLNIFFHADTSPADTLTANATVDEAELERDIERAELYVNDVKINSVSEVDGTALNTDGTYDDVTDFHYNFGSSFTLEDNDMVRLLLDLDTDAEIGDYRFAFTIDDFDSAEYQGTGEDVADADSAGTATGNLVEIVEAEVSITRNDGFPADDSAVAGVNNKLFFRFLVDNQEASEVTIRSLDFDVITLGTAFYFATNTNFFSDFYLKVEGETGAMSDLEDFTAVDGDEANVSFTSINRDIAPSEQLVVGLYGNIQAGAGPVDDLRFTLDVSDSVIDDAQGDALAAINLGTDVLSTTFDVSDGATLEINIDGNTPDEDIITANRTVDLATWVFEADDAAVEVTDVYVANNFDTTAPNSPDAASDFLINRYELVVNGQVRDSDTPTGGNAEFNLSGANKILVPEDGQVRVTVRGVLNSITQVSQTDADFKLALYGIEANTVGVSAQFVDADITSGNVMASDDDSAVDSAPTGNTLIAYETIPTLATVPLSSSVLNNGTKDIYKFSVAANTAGDLNWGMVVIEVTGSCTGDGDDHPLGCIATSGLALYDAGNNLISATFAKDKAENKLFARLATTSMETITAGSVETYRLQAVLSTFANGDSMSLRIADDVTTHADPASLSVQASASGWSGTGGPTVGEGAFIWSDNAGTYRSATDAHWFNGENVPGLNTNVQDLIFPSS